MKEMFQVKINENKYYVFGENELTIIGNPKTNLLTCPRYYDLEILNGNSTIIKYTNNEPVIINSNEITDNSQFILEFSDYLFFLLCLSGLTSTTFMTA